MNEQKNTILIADDEPRITELISDFLIADGYNTLIAQDGEAALQLFNNHKEVSLVILDIMMPEMDGWQVCREIRKTSNVPVMLLTARSEEFDQLMGFESGADDYVTKPFSPAVLVKRIEALLRRSNPEATELNTQKGLVINKDAYVAYMDGKVLELTLKEFEILVYLSDNHSRVLTRDQILNAVWGYDFEGDNRTVDSHVARLRTKLGDFGNTKLKTVYGMGYKFEW
ncbi:MAG: response regulator transcription factor [Ruminococcaceae bacterium]|nr:response regulator transcription factor [Oscillospiraceae bacterium]